MESGMLIKTIGKPKNVSVSVCTKAVNFYGKKLLTPGLFEKIELELEFSSEDMSSDVYGYCDWNFDNHRPKDFTITIRPNLSKKQTLLAIAHEMVHLKQYARGEMKDYVRKHKVKFNNKIYDHKKIDYWEHPWEIEAHGREKGLYYYFLNDERKK